MVVGLADPCRERSFRLNFQACCCRCCDAARWSPWAPTDSVAFPDAHFPLRRCHVLCSVRHLGLPLTTAVIYVHHHIRLLGVEGGPTPTLHRVAWRLRQKREVVWHCCRRECRTLCCRWGGLAAAQGRAQGGLSPQRFEPVDRSHAPFVDVCWSGVPARNSHKLLSDLVLFSAATGLPHNVLPRFLRSRELHRL